MGRSVDGLFVVFLSLCMTSMWVFPSPASGALSTTFYAKTCPNLETYVKNAVTKKVKQTFVTIPATLRLFFHDCAVTGCDASVLVASAGSNKAEKDHPDNLSLAGDGFDTVIQAKKAVDADPKCRNKVSCADILALATRDVIVAAGGPTYKVELGRFDGKTSTASSVEGKLPKPSFKLDQLNSAFQKLGLSQTDMIALSAAHTLGFSHCNHVAGRIKKGSVDPTLNPTYAQQLQGMCPVNVDPRIAINMDPTTPRIFDNAYYKNLQQRKGLFTSDQDLWENSKSKATVNDWAKNAGNFNAAFTNAMIKLGRFGVKTSSTGNIRRDCSAFN